MVLFGGKLVVKSILFYWVNVHINEGHYFPFMSRYRSMGHFASQQLSNTFFLLLDIMQFFDQYHAKRIDIAFEVIMYFLFSRSL